MIEPSSRLIDVSHLVEEGLITYIGLPGPVICDFLSREDSRQYYSEGTQFQIGKIEMVANTGTYVDAPFHRFENGKDLAQLPLEKLANLDAVVIRIDIQQTNRIDLSAGELPDIEGRAVLFHTGWSQFWNTPQYFEGHPFLTEKTANSLRDGGAVLVGIDSLNIDDMEDGRRPVHTTLLGAGIPIVEHLTDLHLLPDRGFRFFAVPVKVRSFGSFPVRAYGLVPDGS